MLLSPYAYEDFIDDRPTTQSKWSTEFPLEFSQVPFLIYRIAGYDNGKIIKMFFIGEGICEENAKSLKLISPH